MEKEIKNASLPNENCSLQKNLSDFMLLQEIGGGAFGKVYLGKLRETGKFHAIKAIKKA